MDKKEFISISEYAEIKGISKQAVYKQLNTKLKKYSIEVDGKKYLSIEALEENEFNSVEQNESTFNQRFNSDFQLILEEQLAKKDEQIESLMRQIENLQEQNKTLSDLLRNSQVLLVAEKKNFLIENGEIKEKEKRGIFGIFRKRDKQST